MTTTNLSAERQTFEMVRGDEYAFVFEFVDENDDPIDMSGSNDCVASVRARTDEILDDATGFAETISGAGNNFVTKTFTETKTTDLTGKEYQFSVRATVDGATREILSAALKMRDEGIGGSAAGSSAFKVTVGDVHIKVQTVAGPPAAAALAPYALLDGTNLSGSGIDTLLATEYVSKDSYDDALIGAGNVPSGGTAGTALQKASGDDFDTYWGAVVDGLPKDPATDDALFPNGFRTRQGAASYLGFVSTTYTDKAMRMYLMPDGVTPTTGIGSTLKWFMDPFDVQVDGDSYRDFNVTASIDLGGDTGYHGHGVFWLNSKVGRVGGSAALGTFHNENPDIALGFQDGAACAARAVYLAANTPGFVIGPDVPELMPLSSAVVAEIQGDMTIGSLSAGKAIKWASNAGTLSNAFQFDQLDAKVTIGGDQSAKFKKGGGVEVGPTGVLSNSSKRGFLEIPVMDGAPTADPFTDTGVPVGDNKCVLVFDKTNSELYARIDGGSWISVALS